MVVHASDPKLYTRCLVELLSRGGITVPNPRAQLEGTEDRILDGGRGKIQYYSNTVYFKNSAVFNG